MKEINDGTKETNSHWAWDRSPVICVDFHHTITNVCEACQGYKGYYFLQDGAKEALLTLQELGFVIVIYTGDPRGNKWVGHDKNYQGRILDFLKENKIPYNSILFEKPPAMFIIDDRAIHHKSWNETIKEVKKRLECRTNRKTEE